MVRGTRTLCSFPLHDPEAAADAIVALDLVTPLDAVVAVDDQGTLAAARGRRTRWGCATISRMPLRPPATSCGCAALLDAAEVAQPAFAVVPPTAEADEIGRLSQLGRAALCRQADDACRAARA